MSQAVPAARAPERDAACAALRRAPFVLVTGGKGGVGKSTIALNLALELARSGRRALLVDLDLGLANLGVLLRLAAERTLEDFLTGRAAFEQCVARGPRGLDVLPAGSGTPAMAEPDGERRRALCAALAAAAGRYDLVIGDSAAGIGPDVLGFAALAQKTLVVTTPDPAALTDAYGLIKALDAFGEEAHLEVPTPDLVVNLASGIDEAERAAERISIVTQRFLARAPRLFGWLPRARSIAEAARTQRPFALGGAGELELGCLRRLAERVARALPQGPPRAALPTPSEAPAARARAQAAP